MNKNFIAWLKKNNEWYPIHDYILDLIIFHLCEVDKISVDVGCYRGRFTWWMARRSRLVYAFDPQPEILKYDTSIYSDCIWVRPLPEKVIYINTCLGDTEKISTYTMFDSKGWNGIHGNAFKNKDLNVISTRPVNVSRLDSFLRDNVSLVKIDAESADEEVVRGSLHLINSSKASFVTEVSPSRVRYAVTLFSSFGYNCYPFVYKMNNPMITGLDYKEQEILNILYVHKSKLDKLDGLFKDVNELLDIYYHMMEIDCLDSSHIISWLSNKIL